MTPDERAAAWADILNRGPGIGFGEAVGEVFSDWLHQDRESMARRFLIDPHHTWTGAEVAALLRGEQ